MKVVAVLRVKNVSRWFRRTLASIAPVVDAAIVLDDGSTDETPAICREFPFVVDVLRQEGLPLDETRDFNALLRRAMELGADWVLKMDGDEELEPGAERTLRAALSRPGVSVVSIQFLHFWDDDRTIRVDRAFAPMVNWFPRLFNLSRQNKAILWYGPTRHGGNLVCSHVPYHLRGRHVLADVIVYHYGHQDAEHRRAKHGFYTRNDPAFAARGFYDHLLGRGAVLRPFRRPPPGGAGRWGRRLGVALRNAFAMPPFWSALTRPFRGIVLTLKGLRVS